MKKVILLALSIFLLTTTFVYAEWVSGYYNRRGVWISGYNRSDRNYTVRDNYSYIGNRNPYTGQTGTNYYRNNRTSAYYGRSGRYSLPTLFNRQFPR